MLTKLERQVFKTFKEKLKNRSIQLSYLYYLANFIAGGEGAGSLQIVHPRK